jgi:SPP1 family predicted phage head-tail adaptor
VDARRLIHRVTLQSGQDASDGHDGLTETWTDASPRRLSARVQTLSGRDLERARQISPVVTHEITVRWWRDYVSLLNGGRARVVWHDGVIGDRTLELVEPPRETEPRVSLMMLAREAR